MAPNYNSIAIVGVGLIGGSIAAALRRRGFAGRIRGIGRDEARLQRAVDAGLLTDFSTDVESHASEFVIVGTPVDRIADDVRAAARGAERGTLITDVGSVKGAICRDLAAGLPAHVSFVGSHPLAGSHHRGFEHAHPELFQDRVCVVTPGGNANRDALERVTRFWEFLGMRVVEMDADAHDRILAETSHLPHVVAAALSSCLEDDWREFTATGFADTTRIAAGDPGLWTAILLENAEAIQAALARYEAALRAIRDAIAAGDSAGLLKCLASAKSKRDGL